MTFKSFVINYKMSKAYTATYIVVYLVQMDYSKFLFLKGKKKSFFAVKGKQHKVSVAYVLENAHAHMHTQLIHIHTRTH